MTNPLFTAKGRQAEESANKQNLDLKKVYIRLKEGESVRVRLLEVNENTVREYMAQGEYNLDIFTQPDISPLTGEPSPLTVAAKSGIEKFKNLYLKKRYLIVFADIDTGELRVWDASKTQGKDMLDLLNEYADSKDEIAFTLKRTGVKKETKFNLIPIMKMKDEDKEKFAKFDEVVVESALLDNVLIPRTAEQQIALLKDAGFPVADFFDVKDEESKADEEPSTEEEVPTENESIADETENF